MSNNKILENLNDRQLEAVKQVDGETLVIAGAGSGKTSVLTRRVAYLISEGVTPGSILCLTFTNKAAKEMRERVIKLLNEVDINIVFPPAWQNDYTIAPLLCTFHSLGVRVLREFYEESNLNQNFNILDVDDQLSLIRRILKELNIDSKIVPPQTIRHYISKCKQELLIPSKASELGDYPEELVAIYKKYQEDLESSSNVDFDDLIMKPFILLRDNKEVRETLQARFKHVMVDEFQDTNSAQFELIKLLYP